MKTREEQVEEMAKAIYATGVALDGTDYAFGVYDNDDHFHRMANALYAAGYRKERDTVKEILQMIKDKGLFRYGGYLLHDSDFDTIGKLYGVEVEE